MHVGETDIAALSVRGAVVGAVYGVAPVTAAIPHRGLLGSENVVPS